MERGEISNAFQDNPTPAGPTSAGQSLSLLTGGMLQYGLLSCILVVDIYGKTCNSFTLLQLRTWHDNYEDRCWAQGTCEKSAAEVAFRERRRPAEGSGVPL